MGRDKALLELCGKPLFLHMVELLRPHVAEVVLLGPTEQFAHFGIPILPDRSPGSGPLAALCTGLESTAYEWNVFLACDLPFVEGRFLDFLLGRALAGSAEAVIPRTADGWQPLCAAYHRSCLPTIRQALDESDAAVIGVLPNLRVDTLEADELQRHGFGEAMFLNLNTQADWEAVLERMAKRAR